VALTLEKDLDEAREVLEKLADLGIDLDEVTDELLVEGVDKFAKPFDKLLQAIEEKRERMAIK
jgi:transaldolase